MTTCQRATYGNATAERAGFADPDELGRPASSWLRDPKGCRGDERGPSAVEYGNALWRVAEIARGWLDRARAGGRCIARAASVPAGRYRKTQLATGSEP